MKQAWRSYGVDIQYESIRFKKCFKSWNIEGTQKMDLIILNDGQSIKNLWYQLVGQVWTDNIERWSSS